MEVVGTRSKEAITTSLWDVASTGANVAEQWISAAKKKIINKKDRAQLRGFTAGDCIRKKKNGYCLQRDLALYWASRRS